MLNASMANEQQFRKGLIQYLKEFSGLNTNTDDLWNSLTQVCACLCVCACVYAQLFVFGGMNSNTL